MPNKSVDTALALVCSTDVCTKINDIRKLYDKAYPRWMPHLNFIFPFVPEERFVEIKTELEPVLSGIGQIDLFFDKIEHFSQKQNMITVHLSPDKSTLEKLTNIDNIIKTAMPGIKSQHAHFKPHITLGQFTKSDYEFCKKTELDEWFGSGIKFSINSLVLLKRYCDTPFCIKEHISLL
jgi:2'-5' RNA ligase